MLNLTGDISFWLAGYLSGLALFIHIYIAYLIKTDNASWQALGKPKLFSSLPSKNSALVKQLSNKKIVTLIGWYTWLGRAVLLFAIYFIAAVVYGVVYRT